MYSRNKKLVYIAFTILIGLTTIFYANFKLTKETYSNNKNLEEDKVKLILIDPGHGGIDGGASSASGLIEKDLNLKISLKIKNSLDANKYKVIMTRDEDKGLYTEDGTIRKKKIEDLNNRCKLKKDSNCNMFVSIHLNTYPEAKYSGAQIWYSKNKESQKLATIMQENFKKDIDENNKRKAKPALDDYKVLRCNDEIPAIIIECGFLSNPKEAENLNSDSYQNKMAESIVKSINEYYDKNDKI